MTLRWSADLAIIRSLSRSYGISRGWYLAHVLSRSLAVNGFADRYDLGVTADWLLTVSDRRSSNDGKDTFQANDLDAFLEERDLE